MATQTEVEKMQGSADAITQPVHVWDDAGATLGELAAITAAQSAAPVTILGVGQDDVPTVEQLSDFAWRIHINYRVYTPKRLTPLTVGEIRYNFDVRVQSKRLRYAPEIGKFSPNEDFPSQNGLLTIQGERITPYGVLIDAPPSNAGATIVILSSLITATWAAKVRLFVGSFNSSTIAGWEAGECMITRLHAQQVDDDNSHINIEWSLKDNVTSENRGEVTGISYRGHDYTWEWAGVVPDRDGEALAYVPQAVFVNEVWDSYNHNLLGIDPPTKP